MLSKTERKSPIRNAQCFSAEEKDKRQKKTREG